MGIYTRNVNIPLLENHISSIESPSQRRIGELYLYIYCFHWLGEFSKDLSGFNSLITAKNNNVSVIQTDRETFVICCSFLLRAG